MSVPLAVEDAVAVVYGFLLFVSPSNCRRIVICTRTQIQVVKYTDTAARCQVLYW